jgi:hypothetical protein
MYKCKVCNRKMEVTEIDRAEGIAWVCCPEYMKGEDEHDSYQVKLTEEVEEIFLNQ